MSAFTQRTLGYVVAGAIAAVLLFWIFGKVDGYFAGQDAEITAASQAQLAAHPAVLRWRAKLTVLQARYALDRIRWHDSAEVLVAAGDTSIDGLHALLFVRTAEAHSCGLALLACEQRALLAEAESDSLVRRLGAQVKVRDHPCGVWVGLGVAGGAANGAGLALGVGCRLLRSPWP